MLSPCCKRNKSQSWLLSLGTLEWFWLIMSLSRVRGSQKSESAGKEKNGEEKKKKNGREGQSGGGGNKKRERERQASFRNRGRVKERAPGSKTNHLVQYFYSFSFPQGRALSCHFIDKRAVTGSFPRSWPKKLKRFFPPKRSGFPGNGLLLSKGRVSSLGGRPSFSG